MIRIGIIGTGLIAKEHAHAISMVRDRARLVAAADIDSERLEDFCGSFQVPHRYQDAAALIAGRGESEDETRRHVRGLVSVRETETGSSAPFLF